MKILQIIPAQPGWHVAYPAGATQHFARDDEAGDVVFVAIACWALVETSAGNRVVPMSGGERNAALTLEDPENARALGISPPGRQPSDWAASRQVASDRSAPRPSEKAKEASRVVHEKPPAPVISMDDVMKGSTSVLPKAITESDNQIPSGSDLLDLDF